MNTLPGAEANYNEDFSVYVIYNTTTKDFAGSYVGRLWKLAGGQALASAEPLIISSDLEEVRTSANKMGFNFNAGRHECDDPVILEVWM